MIRYTDHDYDDSSNLFWQIVPMSVNKSFGSKKINLFTSETGRNRTEDLGNEITYVRLK